jgi:hypothetical protein
MLLMDTSKKFPINGNVVDIVKSGSLLHLLYCGMSPQSEIMYDEMKKYGTPFVNNRGVISWDGCHVFDKCVDSNCHICNKYKKKC